MMRLSYSKIILDDLKTIFEWVYKDFNAELVNSLKGFQVVFLEKRIILKSCKIFGETCYGVHSYFAGSCGGAPFEIIKLYIQQQQPYL